VEREYCCDDVAIDYTQSALVYARALARLREVFQTENQVQIFASSGTGAMESAVANLTRPGEPALVASCGNFGERWAKLCDAYGADTRHLAAEWGAKVDPAALDKALAENEGVKVVFTTFSETSTGVVNDVQALTEVAHRHGALIVVDAVSGMGAVPLPQDEWGVDVVVAGSQKALMAAPGLGFASANAAALEHAAQAPTGRFYFDWARTVAGQDKQPPDSPFTPAVGLIQGLEVALGMIAEEGLQNVYERHRILGRAARAAVAGLDLELLDLGQKLHHVAAILLRHGDAHGRGIERLGGRDADVVVDGCGDALGGGEIGIAQRHT